MAKFRNAHHAAPADGNRARIALLESVLFRVAAAAARQTTPLFMRLSPLYVLRPARRAWLGLALALLIAAASGGARAQTRPIALPPNAVYGELKAFQYPIARIGKRSLRVSPGARIFNAQNLIVQPGGVPQQSSVMYRLDINGDIGELWLLLPEEAAEIRKRKKDSR